jgi:dihydroorotate dehydrogenase (fumarate)
VSLLERAAAAVDIPVIGSLNGVTPSGWVDYSRAMEDAGAAAVELNIYYLPGDVRTSGRDVEQRHVDILSRVVDAIDLPVAVKLSPYFSSTGEMALRLDEAGANGLVLFNRFLQPEIDADRSPSSPASAFPTRLRPGCREPGSLSGTGGCGPRSPRRRGSIRRRTSRGICSPGPTSS